MATRRSRLSSRMSARTLFQNARRRTIHRKKPDCALVKGKTQRLELRRHQEQALRIIELEGTRQVRHIGDPPLFDSQITGVNRRGGFAKHFWMQVTSIW